MTTNIYLEGNELSWVDSYCYLGYDVYNMGKNTDEAEINKRCHAMRVRANVIARRFGKASDSVKKQLFQTYFSSIYCSSLWVPQTQKCVNKVRVTFNNCFRLIFGIYGAHSISHEFVSRGINMFQAVRRQGCFSLLRRVLFPKNDIIMCIINHVGFRTSIIYGEWLRVLF